MHAILLGILSGVIFGILSVLLMIPLKFENKMSAMLGSFLNRFAIGFMIGTVVLPAPSWIKGVIVGLLLSLPDAIITKSYVPILGVGIVGGAVIGLVIG